MAGWIQEPASAHWWSDPEHRGVVPDRRSLRRRLPIGGSGIGGARLWEARHEPDPGVTEAYDLAAIIDVDGSGVGHSARVIDRGEGRSAPQETVTA